MRFLVGFLRDHLSSSGEKKNTPLNLLKVKFAFLFLVNKYSLTVLIF